MEFWESPHWKAFQVSLLQFLPRLVTSVVLLLVFWLLAAGTGRVVQRLARARHIDSGLVQFLGGAARLTLLLVGAVTALGTLGVDVSALVAGLGLTGFALGFALKDIISNALAGIMVLFFKPFRQGDQISVTALEGTVLEINMRYTVLDAGGQVIFIPNANLITNPVTVKKKGVVTTAIQAPAASITPAEPSGPKASA
jgi:small-conductance mechanosensitive channel